MTKSANRIYDYIVVGSGPGGSPVGYYLHEAGADVLILEAGKYFRKNTFPRNEADTAAQLYWGGGIEYDEKAKMAFLRARVVGGTSIVNQALLNRFDDIAWKDWKDQSGVDFFNAEAMTPHYDEVLTMVTMYEFSRPEFNRNAELYTEACDRLGFKWGFLQRAQSDCALEKGNDCIACLGGCHRDSKQSSMVAYLQKGERKGLKVLSGTEIDHVEDKGDHVILYGTHGGTRVKFRTRKVIMAGGSFGTTQMLLRSGYRNSHPALGKYFSTHPQFMNFGVFDEPVNAHKGYFQTVASKDDSFREKGFKLEIVFAPPVSIAMLFPEYGKAHQSIMKDYTKISCVEVAVRDEHTGHIRIDKKGKLVVDKELTDQDRRRRDAGLDAVRQIMSTAGAKRVMHAPMYFGLHLMGGASMGSNSSDSVVGPDFLLHGSKNVYVCDSSLFPNAPGINPSLTIFALSRKLSEQLINGTS